HQAGAVELARARRRPDVGVAALAERRLEGLPADRVRGRDLDVGVRARLLEDRHRLRHGRAVDLVYLALDDLLLGVHLGLDRAYRGSLLVGGLLVAQGLGHLVAQRADLHAADWLISAMAEAWLRNCDGSP